MAAALVIGAAVAVGVAPGAGERGVLVLVREVPPGHEVLAEDLAVSQVSGLEGVDAFERPQQVVGRTMAYPAPRGAVLTRWLVGDAVFPNNGNALVDVAVKPGRFPHGYLTAGARVGVINTGLPARADRDEPVITARVLRTRALPDGAMGVTLQVAQWDAAAVGTASASGSVALALLSEAG